MAEAQLGPALRSMREQAGLSQEELAAKAQVSRATIQNWEGSRTKPRRAESRRLAVALGVSVDALMALASGAAQQEIREGLGVTVTPDDPEELRRLLREAEEELAFLSPRYESTRRVIAARLEREIAELKRKLEALGEKP